MENQINNTKHCRTCRIVLHISGYREHIKSEKRKLHSGKNTMRSVKKYILPLNMKTV